MRHVQQGLRAVFGLTLASLIPFWIVKGTQPAGHAVLWVLYGVLLASGLGWGAASFFRWREGRRDDALHDPRWQERHQAAFAEDLARKQSDDFGAIDLLNIRAEEKFRAEARELARKEVERSDASE